MGYRQFTLNIKLVNRSLNSITIKHDLDRGIAIVISKLPQDSETLIVDRLIVI